MKCSSQPHRQPGVGEAEEPLPATSPVPGLAYSSSLLTLTTTFSGGHVLSYCCCSVTQSFPTLFDPKDCSTPCFSVLHCLPELAQTQLMSIELMMLSNHLILCRPLLLLPSSPFLESESFPVSQHQVAKVLELQLQHQLLFWLNCN